MGLKLKPNTGLDIQDHWSWRPSLSGQAATPGVISVLFNLKFCPAKKQGFFLVSFISSAALQSWWDCGGLRHCTSTTTPV